MKKFCVTISQVEDHQYFIEAMDEDEAMDVEEV